LVPLFDPRSGDCVRKRKCTNYEVVEKDRGPVATSLPTHARGLTNAAGFESSAAGGAGNVRPGAVASSISICRSIIDAHGGRLWADAIEPSGTVFQFTVPTVEKEFMESAPERHRPEEPHAGTALAASRRGVSKITDDPTFQGAGPFNIVWTASNQYCRSRVYCLNEVCVEFNSDHRRR
jgi:hypothetical protein